jgi:hypothetical protein
MRTAGRQIATSACLAACMALLAVGCMGSPRATCPPGATGGGCLRVLFVGNSYTYVNDLPGMLAVIAGSAGHLVETRTVARGGATLADAVDRPETADAIATTRWDVVVLQEQSEIPAAVGAREAQMYPATRRLARQIEASAATPLLFDTWAHRDGWPEAGLPTYERMQREVDRGYLAIAHELGIAVAPVGAAWLEARTDAPGMNLWQGDGSHPNERGTYLAACVFYAALFHESPVGSTFDGGLSDQDAQVLQRIAATTVLARSARWDHP